MYTTENGNIERVWQGLMFPGPKPASFMIPRYFDLLWTLAIRETKWRSRGWFDVLVFCSLLMATNFSLPASPLSHSKICLIARIAETLGIAPCYHGKQRWRKDLWKVLERSLLSLTMDSNRLLTLMEFLLVCLGKLTMSLIGWSFWGSNSIG